MQEIKKSRLKPIDKLIGSSNAAALQTELIIRVLMCFFASK